MSHFAFDPPCCCRSPSSDEARPGCVLEHIWRRSPALRSGSSCGVRRDLYISLVPGLVDPGHRVDWNAGKVGSP
eukprot:667963-Pyramimonas_sp.AAC.1